MRVSALGFTIRLTFIVAARLANKDDESWHGPDCVCLSAVRWSLYWRIQFQALTKRIGKYKAITAIARKLLVTIWQVLTKPQSDRHAYPRAVARSLMTWASLHHLARSLGVHRLTFVRQRLELLGLLDCVSDFRANGRTHFLALT